MNERERVREKTTEPGASLELTIPPDPRFARTVRDALIAFAAYHGIAAMDAESLLFAVGEALANAVEHADSASDIFIRCEIDEDRIVATIVDSGRGFTGISGEKAPLPDALEERGRGLPIMQRCTDFLAVETMPGKGTAVTLGRYRKNRRNMPRSLSAPAS